MIFLLGCADLMAIGDVFADLTDPLVVQATYVGVEPLPEGVSLEGSSWASGSRAEAFLADAGAFSDLESAPIGDAMVSLEVDGLPVDFVAGDPGSFSASAEEGLDWSAGVDATLVVERDGEHLLALTTPPAPAFSVAEEHVRGMSMTVSLEGQAFDNIVVTTVRMDDGVTTYDSLPTDIAGLYKLTHSSSSLSAEIPGDAFQRSGYYAVGVMGVVNADPDTYEGVNLALSALSAGSMSFRPVYVP